MRLCNDEAMSEFARLSKEEQPETFDSAAVTCAVPAADDIDESVESGDAVINPRSRFLYQLMTEPAIGSNVVGFNRRCRASIWRFNAHPPISCLYDMI